MATLIRAADLTAERRTLRSEAVAETVGAVVTVVPPAAVDWRSECERLQREMAELRTACDAALAQRDARLKDERAALAASNAEQAQRALAQAAERGQAEGFEKGRADGAATLREQAGRLAAAAESVSAARTTALNEAEDGMVDIVFEAVCRLLGNASAQRAAVAAAVAAARSRVDRETVLTVSVDRDDLDILLAQGAAPEGVRFVADDGGGGGGIGGCSIAYAQGTLDARLATQLDILRKTLLDVRATRKAGA